MANEPRRNAVPSQAEEFPVRFRIICVKPPNPDLYGVVFGLQDNSTTLDWVIHPGRPQANGDIHFECECLVHRHPRTGAPNFLGPFVHGDPQKRFFYLSWRPKGWRPGQPEPPCPPGVRRMKVHLSSITWSVLDAVRQTKGVLEATVEGTTDDGFLNCGSVPLLGGGWTVGKK